MLKAKKKLNGQIFHNAMGYCEKAQVFKGEDDSYRIFLERKIMNSG